jgi:hypothetical protein
MGGRKFLTQRNHILAIDDWDSDTSADIEDDEA